MEGERSSGQRNSNPDRPAWIWFLAIIAALYCLIVVILFADSQISVGSSIWPFPGIYFIEIILLGSMGLFSIARNRPPGEHVWTSLPWLGAGGLLAFVILGAWTIGFFLIPAMVLSILVGATEDRRKKDNLPLHVILFLIAAIVQAVIVLLVVSINFS